ncbi:MAG: cytochrome C oxidase subunit IV family protein [Acidobacteria bacterium]|nr:cytochrome C oxidase subunit IV family protein [Acidobacteriota bacterium]
MQLVWIWALLVGLTVVEVLLAVPRLAAGLFVIVLLGLSVGKTALIVNHFMHLKFSPRVLGWLLFPLLVAFIVSLLAVLPDAVRIGGGL